MSILLRSMVKFLMVYPLVSLCSQTAFQPHLHLTLFNQSYERLREWLLDHGLKLLAPLSQVQGQETAIMVVVSVLVLVLTLLFMLGDKRGIIGIIAIKCI